MEGKIKLFVSVTAVCVRAVPPWGTCCAGAGQGVLPVLLLLTLNRICFFMWLYQAAPTALKGTECHCSLGVLVTGQGKVGKTKHSNSWKHRDSQKHKILVLKPPQTSSCRETSTEGCLYTVQLMLPTQKSITEKGTRSRAVKASGEAAHNFSQFPSVHLI